MRVLVVFLFLRNKSVVYYVFFYYIRPCITYVCFVCAFFRVQLNSILVFHSTFNPFFVIAFIQIPLGSVSTCGHYAICELWNIFKHMTNSVYKISSTHQEREYNSVDIIFIIFFFKSKSISLRNERKVINNLLNMIFSPSSYKVYFLHPKFMEKKKKI
jgi:hypothetical protein